VQTIIAWMTTEGRSALVMAILLGALSCHYFLRRAREERAAAERIRHLSEHDGLTGLANRPAFQTRLDQALQNAWAGGGRVALLTLDLDRFKEFNDVFGHDAGDALLREVAERLKGTIAQPSFVARLGGDEFAVVQVAAPQPDGASALAETILDALREPFRMDGRALTARTSIGVALFPEDGQTAHQLLANADIALSRAKSAGRDLVRFFQRDMDEALRERRALARELERGVNEGELVLHYQPLAECDDGELCAFEALVRWRHPTRGLLYPDAFIPIAEESGVIVALGERVLQDACRDAAAWPKPIRVAVNLSPLQLNQQNLPGRVHEILLETGLPPARLELEVTETALLKDMQRAVDNLRRLKALGVSISMDDFGTGYSSLSTLQSFPFDKIKIDRSFIDSAARDVRAGVIVRAILGLGRSLGVPVVAEGVESHAHLSFLRAEGCPQMQGYLIGRPGPIENHAALFDAPATEAAVAA
jgi:diguanylate cyclase (GGDEF)-like protein